MRDLFNEIMVGLNDFFDSLFLTESQLELIKEKYNSLSLTNNECVNDEYITKYKELKNKNNNEIVINTKREKECCICYDELLDITSKTFNSQCHHCQNIFHKSCLTKWISMGNSTCPYCRQSININNSYKTL